MKKYEIFFQTKCLKRKRYTKKNNVKGIYIIRHIVAVEEHSVVGRSMIERTYGRGRRENAGISSESKVRILAVESLRFPGEGSSAQGKSGPKVRLRSVADGQQV